MRRKDDRHPSFAVQLPEQAPNISGTGLIQTPSRIGEEEKAGVRKKRPRDLKTSHHGRRADPDHGIRDPGKPEQFDDLRDSSFPGSVVQAAQPGMKLQILPSGQRPIERRILKDNAHAPPHIPKVSEDRKGRSLSKCRNREEDRHEDGNQSLPALAAGAEDAQDLSSLHVGWDRTACLEPFQALYQPLNGKGAHEPPCSPDQSDKMKPSPITYYPGA
jgi:hypothetical protein